jgi:hypothetical protein
VVYSVTNPRPPICYRYNQTKIDFTIYASVINLNTPFQVRRVPQLAIVMSQFMLSYVKHITTFSQLDYYVIFCSVVLRHKFVCAGQGKYGLQNSTSLVVVFPTIMQERFTSHRPKTHHSSHSNVFRCLSSGAASGFN